MARIPMSPADIVTVLKEDYRQHKFAIGSAREIVHDRHGLGHSLGFMWKEGGYADQLREEIARPSNPGETDLRTFMDDWREALLTAVGDLRDEPPETPEELLQKIMKYTEVGEAVLRTHFIDSEVDLTAPITEMAVESVRGYFLKQHIFLKDPDVHLAGYLASEGMRHIVPIR